MAEEMQDAEQARKIASQKKTNSGLNIHHLSLIT
jgi:hypothetical protein